MASFKHTKTSAKADGADSSLVQPSDWNAEHTVTTSASDVVLGRSTAGGGAVEEVPCKSAARTLMNAASMDALRTALAGILGADIAQSTIPYGRIQKAFKSLRLLGSGDTDGMAISGAANNGSGLIRLTVVNAGLLIDGGTYEVKNVLGTTEANGTWVITYIDSTHVDLVGSTFTNTYTSGGTIGGGDIQELAIGAGLSITGSAPATLKATNTPMAGAFVRLKIDVATNTTATVSADSVVMSDGSSGYHVAAVSETLNMATTGANALDSGAIAAATWYAVWAIAKPDGTVDVLASTSFTAPTLPTGYTMKAYLGALRTAPALAQLMGTIQRNKRAQYVLGLAQTGTTYPVIRVGDNGPALTAYSVSGLVPSTASVIKWIAANDAGTTRGTVKIGPNANSGGNITAFSFITNGQGDTEAESGEFMLESTNVYVYASNDVGTYCTGWEDL